jgi:hypothetical protein
MALTPDQVVALVEARSMGLRRAADGWHAETRKGERLHRDGRPTVAEAVEAAEATLAAADARELVTGAVRIVQALARGRYHLRPRLESYTDPEGEPAQRRVFDAYRNGTPEPTVRGRLTLVQAVIDMEALLGP